MKSAMPSHDADNIAQNKRIILMALMVALGVILHRLEALLPLPSPWVKLGLDRKSVV